MSLSNPRSRKAPSSYANKRWHLFAAYAYVVICIFDFTVFPGIGLLLGKPWTPVTIQGMGIFHLSFGGLCGVGTWAFHRSKQPQSINTETSQGVSNGFESHGRQ